MRVSAYERPQATRQPAWHAMTDGQTAEALSTHPASGLSDAAAATRLKADGPNEIPSARQRPLTIIVLNQFKSPLIYLLLVAAVIAFSLGEPKDATVILAVVIINAIIGALQEGRAERSIESLRLLSAQQARTLRDGRETSIPARDLVAGDIILVAAGDAVPADARLADAHGVESAEAALTGESVPVQKSTHSCAESDGLADRTSMIYAGTLITAGRGKGIVVATGTSTELGRIADATSKATDPKSPLEKRVEQFSHYVVAAAVALFVMIVMIGWVRDLPLPQVFMVAISQMVSMVPEGLPIAMTVALAVGVQRMARRRVIIRRLAAVEALGSTSVICSDKTGTLTRNEMTATQLVTAGGTAISASGAGYAPEGELRQADKLVAAASDAGIRDLLTAAALCNDASLLAPEAGEPRWRPLGDPTEAALLTLARKGGLEPRELRKVYPRAGEIAFDPSAKLMATGHVIDGRPRVFIKGAPEVVLELCAQQSVRGRIMPLTEMSRTEVLAEAQGMAASALRVLAFAAVDDMDLVPGTGFEALRGQAAYLGLIGQMDPPRDEVRAAIKSCRQAGIRTVMITGDHKATGLAIARSLGIHQEGDLACDGRELAELSDEELNRKAEMTSVYARVHPSQKQRIVSVLQQRGHVVAMTGDGVNDAPALASADVGVAMGITGTDVAKEASKIVIMDDNFATIVAGIEEGRLVRRNLQKVVLYLVTTSAAEVLILLAAILAGYPPPLAAVQILWINLVTEGSVTVNLIMEPPEGDEMAYPPPAPGTPLITREVLARMALMTPTIALLTIGWFITRLGQGIPFAQVQTETFTLLAVCQWFNVLNCRSSLKSALNKDIFHNKWLIGGLAASNLLQFAVVYWTPLRELFHTIPIPLSEFLVIGAVGSIVLWLEELRKFLARRNHRQRRQTGAIATL